jgi:hypothetical protein
MARIETDPNYTTPTFSRATAGTDIFKKEDVQALAAAMSAHVHDGLGKGLGVIPPAGSIPGSALADGSITSAKIADGTIAMADLAAGATYQVLLALGATANPSTTSTTPVDMAEMTITGTFNGGQVVVFLVTQVSQSALGNGVGLTFNYDGSGSGRLYSYTTGVAGQVMVLNIQESVGALTGSHTIKGQYQAVGGGTATLSGTIRSMFAIEFKR